MPARTWLHRLRRPGLTSRLRRLLLDGRRARRWAGCPGLDTLLGGGCCSRGGSGGSGAHLYCQAGENLMGQAAALLDTYPGTMNVDKGLLAEAIESCLDCFQVCTACADACLSEDDVTPLAKCIRDDLDCASVCAATVQVLSRHTGYDANITRAQLQACLAATQACADSCAEHAGHHEHCRLCEQACRRCITACEQLLSALG